jgi:hypothetical protein
MDTKLLKKHKDIVMLWLQNHPPTRDSDTRLLANIWSHIVGLDQIDKITARQLMAKMVTGELPSSETIRRTRQKIQEQHPELRGKSYKERQSRASSMRNDIKNL